MEREAPHLLGQTNLAHSQSPLLTHCSLPKSLFCLLKFDIPLLRTINPELVNKVLREHHVLLTLMQSNDQEALTHHRGLLCCHRDVRLCLRPAVYCLAQISSRYHIWIYRLLLVESQMFLSGIKGNISLVVVMVLFSWQRHLPVWCLTRESHSVTFLFHSTYKPPVLQNALHPSFIIFPVLLLANGLNKLFNTCCLYVYASCFNW